MKEGNNMKITCVYCGKKFLAEDIEEIICSECVEKEIESNEIQGYMEEIDYLKKEGYYA